MVTELQADKDTVYRLLERFIKRFLFEGVLIIIVCVCAIVTTGNHFRTNGAVDAADKADIRSTSIQGRVETEFQRMALEFERELRQSDERWKLSYDALNKEYRLLQNKVARYEADLHAGDK